MFYTLCVSNVFPVLSALLANNSLDVWHLKSDARLLISAKNSPTQGIVTKIIFERWTVGRSAWCQRMGRLGNDFRRVLATRAGSINDQPWLVALWHWLWGWGIKARQSFSMISMMDKCHWTMFSKLKVEKSNDQISSHPGTCRCCSSPRTLCQSSGSS